MGFHWNYFSISKRKKQYMGFQNPSTRSSKDMQEKRPENTSISCLPSADLNQVSSHFNFDFFLVNNTIILMSHPFVERWQWSCLFSGICLSFAPVSTRPNKPGQCEDLFCVGSSIGWYPGKRPELQGVLTRGFITLLRKLMWNCVHLITCIGDPIDRDLYSSSFGHPRI
jgi:hypothetical protein